MVLIMNKFQSYMQTTNMLAQSIFVAYNSIGANIWHWITARSDVIDFKKTYKEIINQSKRPPKIVAQLIGNI